MDNGLLLIYVKMWTIMPLHSFLSIVALSSVSPFDISLRPSPILPFTHTSSSGSGLAALPCLTLWGSTLIVFFFWLSSLPSLFFNYSLPHSLTFPFHSFVSTYPSSSLSSSVYFFLYLLLPFLFTLLSFHFSFHSFHPLFLFSFSPSFSFLLSFFFFFFNQSLLCSHSLAISSPRLTPLSLSQPSSINSSLPLSDIFLLLFSLRLSPFFCGLLVDIISSFLVSFVIFFHLSSPFNFLTLLLLHTLFPFRSTSLCFFHLFLLSVSFLSSFLLPLSSFFYLPLSSSFIFHLSLSPFFFFPLSSFSYLPLSAAFIFHFSLLHTLFPSLSTPPVCISSPSPFFFPTCLLSTLFPSLSNPLCFYHFLLSFPLSIHLSFYSLPFYIYSSLFLSFPSSPFFFITLLLSTLFLSLSTPLCFYHYLFSRLLSHSPSFYSLSFSI